MALAPSLISSDVAVLLRDRYETTYGIYNHDAGTGTRPLALVAVHPMEDVCNGSRLYERLERFADFQVAKHFGLSLTEFLEFPTDVCEKLLEISHTRQKLEGKITDELTAKLREER